MTASDIRNLSNGFFAFIEIKFLADETSLLTPRFMKTLCLSALASLLLIRCDLLSFTATLANQAGFLCGDLIGGVLSPGALAYRLFCPAALRQPHQIEGTLGAHALVHLLVISGFHFILLKKCLDRSFRVLPNSLAVSLKIGCILLFCLLAGLQTPLLRALLSWGLASAALFALRKPLNRMRVQLLTFAACLSLNPSLLYSLSLQLSFLAGWALAMPRPQGSNKVLTPSLFIYSLLSVPLLSFNFPHPATIVSNSLLGVLVGYMLVVGSMLTFALPFTEPPFNGILLYIDRGLILFAPPVNAPTSAQPLTDSSVSALYCLLVILVTEAHLSFQSKKRQRCF